jgi:hypothetical protein
MKEIQNYNPNHKIKTFDFSLKIKDIITNQKIKNPVGEKEEPYYDSI